MLDQRHREMGDVDPDPPPLEPLRHRDCRPTPAEGVENRVTFVAARLDDPLQEGFGLLRGVAETFISLSEADVPPEVADRNPFLLVEVPLVAGDPLTLSRHYDPP